jgi:hypothetical protein
MYLPLDPMPSTITLPWLRLLLFFNLLLPTAASGSRLEMRQDTLPGDTVRVWQAPTGARAELKKKRDPLAVISLSTAVLTLASMAVFPSLALLFLGSALAVVLGFISFSRIRRRKTFLKGQGWAWD